VSDELQRLLRAGDGAALRALLVAQPALANGTVRWFAGQWNDTDPLHFISDCVSQGWLTNGREGEIAAELLAHGANVEGSPGRESPLIGAASLGAGKVARVLINAGADLERTSLHGARALHWAAWTGEAGIVSALLEHGAALEPRCTEFGATPLFWAVHGYGPQGPGPKRQVDAARFLIRAGANVDTANKHGTTARELARTTARSDMSELLDQGQR
jgi:ankyrin repeat protein